MKFRKTIKMDKFLDEMYKEYKRITEMINIMDNNQDKEIYRDKLIVVNYLCKQISNCRIMLINEPSNHWLAYECEKYKTVREWKDKE